MSMTMAEKMLARAAGVTQLKPGGCVDCKPDGVMVPFPQPVRRILEVCGMFALLKRPVEAEHLA